MNRTKEYKDKYHGALDRMWDLFKFGREVEKDLERKLDLARDEFTRISNICASEIGGEKSACFEEIKGLCNRGLDMTNTK